MLGSAIGAAHRRLLSAVLQSRCLPCWHAPAARQCTSRGSSWVVGCPAPLNTPKLWVCQAAAQHTTSEDTASPSNLQMIEDKMGPLSKQPMVSEGRDRSQCKRPAKWCLPCASYTRGIDSCQQKIFLVCRFCMRAAFVLHSACTTAKGHKVCPAVCLGTATRAACDHHQWAQWCRQGCCHSAPAQTSP